MDSICFEIKRAHWGGVGVTNFLLRRRGVAMTAARFDLMHAIVMFSPVRGPVQVALKQLFGVAASTVSRMLKGLEGLGFIRRVRDVEDRRYKRVTVTPAGMEVLREAAWYTVHDEKVKRRVDLALADARLDENEAQAKREELSAALTRWRWVMGDTAAKPDPWTVMRGKKVEEDPVSRPLPPPEEPSGPELPDLPRLSAAEGDANPLPALPPGPAPPDGDPPSR